MNRDVRNRADELLRMSSAAFLSEMERNAEDRKRDIDMFVRGLYGTTIDEQFKTSEDVENALHACDAKVRKLALFAAAGPWWGLASGTQHSSRIKEMAVADEDPHVRLAALGALGAIFHRTDDKDVGRFLATVVRDESLPLECRCRAYASLLQLAGQGCRDWNAFPEQVAWELVDGYLEKEMEPGV